MKVPFVTFPLICSSCHSKDTQYTDRIICIPGKVVLIVLKQQKNGKELITFFHFKDLLLSTIIAKGLNPSVFCRISFVSFSLSKLICF